VTSSARPLPRQDLSVVDAFGTDLRALFAGCRGEAPLSLLVDLPAGAHELDRAALTVVVMPSVRVAIGRGLQHPVTDRIPG